jgi:hypothetical protein
MPRVKWIKVRVPDPIVPDTETSHYYRLIEVTPDLARKLRPRAKQAELDAHTAWCRSHFASMRNGGIWAVPRSGLVFTRRGRELVLTAQMPWSDELAAAAARGRDVPKTENELLVYQELEFETIRDRFERAGINVRKGDTDAQ